MLYPVPPYTEAVPAWRLESQLTSGGWSYNGYRLDIEERSDVDLYDQNCEQTKSRPFRFRIVLDDGSQHTLHLKDYGDFFSDIYQGDGFYGGPCRKEFSLCPALGLAVADEWLADLFHHRWQLPEIRDLRRRVRDSSSASSGTCTFRMGGA